jgi:hypothetical protein
VASTSQSEELTSAGHRLGQLVGDWWEEDIILPRLKEVCGSLNLFLDNRFINRTCRSDKILWSDFENNFVDYDFVIELGGTKNRKGIPVAFIESFWRRGARHSKDKARDDTNKLLPMRRTYPTCRLLAITACGEFTDPAADYVKSNGVKLLFINKNDVINAFKAAGIQIDYPDNLNEGKKRLLVSAALRKWTNSNRKVVAKALSDLSDSVFSTFFLNLKMFLSSKPQNLIISQTTTSNTELFNSIKDVDLFLNSSDHKFSFNNNDVLYNLKVQYENKDEFQRHSLTKDGLINLLSQITTLTNHFETLNK